MFRYANMIRCVVLIIAVSFLPDPAHAQAPLGISGLLVFVREGAQRGIYTVDPSGSGLTRLTHGYDYRPRWSPDGARIVAQRFFGAEGSLRSYLYVMNADGSGAQRLTRGGTEFQPAWSPDGSEIVFGSGTGHRAEIFAMNADGTNPRRLTHDRFEDSVPAWSPDGSAIAYSSRRHHNTDIYLMAPDGSDQRRLTHLAARDENPDWSPDGTRIVFQRDRHNRRTNSDLYAIAPDGTGVEQLTSSTATEWAPAWSPDGARIAFTSARYGAGVEDIAIMVLGSPITVRFVLPASLDLEPDWQPVAARSTT